MGIPVLVIGSSGSGKSYSLRNFKPEQAGIINVAKKPLPFKNTLVTIESDQYTFIASKISQTALPSVVIDDAQYLMANEFMRRAKEAGYQKFTDIGVNFWNLVQTVIAMPKDKIVYFMGHAEIDSFGNTKFKTIGKMLDEKITVEGMFTIVLRTGVLDGAYYFSTQNDGTDTVKSPPDMFDGIRIPNDLAAVDAEIRKFYEIGDGNGSVV